MEKIKKGENGEKGEKEEKGEKGEKGEKFVKLVKPKHNNSLSAAGAQAAVCSNFGGRLSHDVNSHSINLIVGLLVYYMEAIPAVLPPSLMGLFALFSTPEQKVRRTKTFLESSGFHPGYPGWAALFEHFD